MMTGGDFGYKALLVATDQRRQGGPGEMSEDTSQGSQGLTLDKGQGRRTEFAPKGKHYRQ